jgi:hypothetical protein
MGVAPQLLVSNIIYDAPKEKSRIGTGKTAVFDVI